MKILSIDQATKISGWAIFEDDKLISSGIIDLSKEYIDVLEDRAFLMTNKIKEIIEENEIFVVVLEDVFDTKSVANRNAIKNYKVFEGLSKLLGMIEFVLQSKEILYTIVSPQTWRSACEVKGERRKERKESAIKFVQNMYNKHVSEDESEAICMGYYAWNKVLPKIT